jgi:hypothetical protein
MSTPAPKAENHILLDAMAANAREVITISAEARPMESILQDAGSAADIALRHCGSVPVMR